ncbi:hypothetical protein ACFE04_025893 [Oxalis oulophora]
MKKKSSNSDSDEDDVFYYRYSSATSAGSTTSAATTTTKGTTKGGGGGSSGGLAPSKSTLYASNLDYSLTNSDLHTLFSTFGKIARVTVVKDRQTRKSRGVAFIQFVTRDDALSAARQMDKKILNGRTLTVSIATDNGRAPEFIKKRVYRDKSRCYECGVEGHLSYECPKNQFGARERPVAATDKRARRGNVAVRDDWESDGGYDDHDDDGAATFEDENWASVVDSGADKRLLEQKAEDETAREKKKQKKASYFSDESDEDD